MSSGTVPYIGSKISLISNSEIRYEGILYTINTSESTIALQSVRCFGTEGRKMPEILPSSEVYDFIIFRGQDIKDLTVLEAANAVSDPAIVSINQKPPGGKGKEASGWGGDKGGGKYQSSKGKGGYEASAGYSASSGRGWETSGKGSGSASAARGADRGGYGSYGGGGGKGEWSDRGGYGGGGGKGEWSGWGDRGWGASSSGWAGYGSSGYSDAYSYRGSSGKGYSSKDDRKGDSKASGKGKAEKGKAEKGGKDGKGGKGDSKGKGKSKDDSYKGGRRGGGGQAGSAAAVGELMPEENSDVKKEFAEDFDVTAANDKFDKVTKIEDVEGLEERLKPLQGYNKSTSFFDSISCEATERSAEFERQKVDRDKARQFDKETFGDTRRPPRPTGGRPGKGRRRGA